MLTVLSVLHRFLGSDCTVKVGWLNRSVVALYVITEIVN